MHLITPLASGILGAENGTAIIYVRATSSAPTCYKNAIGDLTWASSTIALGAYGDAIVYVAEEVDIVVSDSTGVIVRSWTETVGSEIVEYSGVSFTGTDRTTAATGTYKPISLKSILDLWATSSGSTDFSVLVGGVKTTLQTAFTAAINCFYNITTYGAVGGGVVDDTTAIKAAVAAATAAGGGIVFIPSGTYLVTDVIALTYKVAILGAGKESTIVQCGTANKNVFSGYCRICGLTLKHSVAATYPLVALSDGTYWGDIIDDCILDGTNTSNALLTYSGDQTFVRNTEFKVYKSYPAIGLDSGSGNYYINIDNCFIRAEAAYAGTALIYTNRGNINNTRFYNYNGGTYSCIYCRSTATARSVEITNCNFGPNGAAGTVTAINLNTLNASDKFYEDNNIFDSTVTPYSYTASDVHGVRFMSRKDNEVYVSGNGAALTIDPLRYDTHYIAKTDVTSLYITAPNGLPGEKLTLIINSTDNANIYFIEGNGFTSITHAAGMIFSLGPLTQLWAILNFVFVKHSTDTGYWMYDQETAYS